jgi:hypothetical protein
MKQSEGKELTKVMLINPSTKTNHPPTFVTCIVEKCDKIVQPTKTWNTPYDYEERQNSRSVPFSRAASRET